MARWHVLSDYHMNRVCRPKTSNSHDQQARGGLLLFLHPEVLVEPADGAVIESNVALVQWLVAGLAQWMWQTEIKFACSR